MPRVAAPLLAALAVAGCGAAERPAQEPDRPVGHLVVHKSLDAGPLFIEGSVTRLRVVGADGDELIDGLRPVDTLDVPLVRRALPAGTYRLTSVELPCEGNCGLLDPPARSTRCELEFEVGAGRTTRVEIVLGVAAGAPASRCTSVEQGR